MSELGIRDFTSFDFISSPGKQGIAGAVDTLRLLDALTPENDLSTVGKMMAEFPLLPRHSRIIVEAITRYPQVLQEVIIATSFLTTSHPFLLPQGEEIEARRAHHRFREPGGDFQTYLKLFRSYHEAPRKDKFCETYYLDQQTMDEIVNINDQLTQIVSSLGVPISGGGGMQEYLCSIARGLIQFICVRSGRYSYRSLTADSIDIHPGSVLFRENPDFIVAGEVVKTSRTFARSVSPLEKSWLESISPSLAESLLPREDQGRGAKGQKQRQAGTQGTDDRGKQVQSSRDTTWQVSLGGNIYQLKNIKGNKKQLQISYEDCKKFMKDPNFTILNQHQNLNDLKVWLKLKS